MMNDHNLDDLIIDTPEKKSGKTKSFLTIIALLIVVLIAAIILTKIILKDPQQDPALLEETESEVISPELTLQDTDKEPTLDEAAIDNTSVNHPKPNTVSSPEKTETLTKESVVIDEAPVTHHKKKPQPKPKAVHKTPPSSKPAAKEIVKIPAPEKKHVTKPATPKKAATPSGAYYIQVGSFSQTPVTGSRLLSAIKKNGYRYRVVTASNGMKKIQIGPYPSRAAVDRAIVRVKDRINKSAFVVKP